MSAFSPKFGTDGVRGVANTELTPSLALKIGTAAGHVIRQSSQSRTIVVGKDTRLSGDLLEAAVAAGFAGMGFEVICIGIAPTPAVSYLVRELGAAAGVVVSASHNPFGDNGIKLFGADGKKLPPDTERSIEAAMEASDELVRPSGGELGRIRQQHGILDSYIRFVEQTAQGRLDGLHIVLDCANGATYEIAPDLFRGLGANVTALHTNPDGVNINRDCGSTHPKDLCDAVRAMGADVGLAFDGDGDRVMMCDERGEIVNGDHMLAICSTGMRTRGELNADLVVTTIMSNAGLEVALENRGIRMVRTDVGDKYVMEEMERSGASLGGEQSGHLLFPRLSVTGDGMLTGLQVLAEMQRTQMKLSDLAGVVEPFPQRLVGLKVRDKTSWQNDTDLQETITEYRAQFGKPEWLSVRASGTEPLLRIMAQDKNETFVEKTIAHLSVMIQERYGVAPA